MVHSLPQVSKWEMAPCISMIYLRPRNWQTDIADMDVAVSVYYSLDKGIAFGALFLDHYDPANLQPSTVQYTCIWWKILCPYTPSLKYWYEKIV